MLARFVLVESIWFGRYGISVSLGTDWNPTWRTLTSAEIGIAAQSLLNRALDDDTLDSGYVRKLCSYFLDDLADIRRRFSRFPSTLNPTTSTRFLLVDVLLSIMGLPTCERFYEPNWRENIQKARKKMSRGCKI